MCALGPNASAVVLQYLDGHGDIGIGDEGGSLELHYHFEDGLNETGPEAEFEPAEVYVRVGDAAMITTTADVSFLGTTTGDPLWILPEVEQAGLPFLGIGTDELSAAFTSVDLTLTGFNGPGEFALWQDGGGTPNVFLQTNGGLAGSLNLLPGGHGHYNWGFTAEGIYEVEFTATGNLAAGGTQSDTATYTFAVGTSTVVPEPSSALLGALGGLFLLRRRRN